MKRTSIQRKKEEEKHKPGRSNYFETLKVLKAHEQMKGLHKTSKTISESKKKEEKKKPFWKFW